MGYVEMLESADKKMIVEEKGLKITEDALLLSNFLRKYFSKKNKNPKIQSQHLRDELDRCGLLQGK